jgi:diacylglycerol kinase family enzyme
VPAALAGAALPLGLIPRLPGLEIVPARRIRLASAGAVPVQADGDPAGCLPAEVTDAPAPLGIVVP